MNCLISKAVAALLLLIICVSSTTPPQGALVDVKLKGTVGYMLDDIPGGKSLLDVKRYIVNNVTSKQWLSRVQLQLSFTAWRQVYRVAHFAPLLQLTLPSQQSWRLKLTSAPYETQIHGHAYIVRNYSFASVLIGRAESIGASDPALADIGGIVTDTWHVPADPEHVFQRAGYACANEAAFSLDTVNSENFYSYFDQECGVEPYTPIANRTYGDNQRNCHWTEFPDETCMQALERTVGSVPLQPKWTRLAWNSTLADQFRYGEMTADTADIVGVTSKLRDDVNIGYKFFDSDSCTLTEGGSGAQGQGGCIDAPGWRQLFRFSASTVNTGKSAVHLGDVFGADYIKNGVFEYNECHLHYHFQHLEDYYFGKVRGRKAGFCLQTSWRYYNNEWTDFNTPYSYCNYQGVGK